MWKSVRLLFVDYFSCLGSCSWGEWVEEKQKGSTNATTMVVAEWLPIIYSENNFRFLYAKRKMLFVIKATKGKKDYDFPSWTWNCKENSFSVINFDIRLGSRGACSLVFHFFPSVQEHGLRRVRHKSTQSAASFYAFMFLNHFTWALMRRVLNLSAKNRKETRTFPASLVIKF